MFSKTNLISTLVTTLWAFLGGYLLWDTIGGSMMDDHTTIAGLIKEEPDFFHLALGCLVTAFVISTVYSKWARGHHSISEGMQFGLWIGLLIGVGSGLINFATSNMMDFNGTLINAVLSIVYFVVMGLLASLVYGKMSSSKA